MAMHTRLLVKRSAITETRLAERTLPALADGEVLAQVGDFALSYKACSMLWRFVSFTGDKDISENVDAQVKAKGGDAITNLSVSSGATIWNDLTVIGLLPDCSSVIIAGDIVKVKAAAGAPAVPAPSPSASTALSGSASSAPAVP